MVKAVHTLRICSTSITVTSDRNLNEWKNIPDTLSWHGRRTKYIFLQKYISYSRLSKSENIFYNLNYLQWYLN